MRKGKSKGKRELAVCVTFERSRLSSDCLTQAYERLVPVARAYIDPKAELTEGAAKRQAARRR